MTSGDELRRWRARIDSPGLQIGQRVQITKGPFGGLVARIHHAEATGLFAVTLDGLAEKLFVVLPDDALEPLPPE